MWIAQYDTYESATGTRRPVVTHMFYGDTRAEAEGVARAHAMADKFFNGCTTKGRFLTIKCWSEYGIYQK